MAENIYDEIEIEDMTYDSALQIYHYPCPCGDRFEIGLADLLDGEDIGVCPSCSLMIKVIFEVVRNHGETAHSFKPDLKLGGSAETPTTWRTDCPSTSSLNKSDWN